MTTALIIRPAVAPKIYVLECDGPRQKHHVRGEGFYRLSTDNHQRCNQTFYPQDDQPYDHALRDWDEPHWEIYQNHDGSIEVHSCRPTVQEVTRGDLHGSLGSVIRIAWPCRPFLRNALRLARRLCKADPIYGCIMAEKDLIGIVAIESAIPVYKWRDAPDAPRLYKSA
jgi:hypothetical protein